MDIRLGTLGLMYTRYGCSGEDHDRYVLRDRRLSVVGEEGRIGVTEGVIVGVGVIDWESCIVWVGGCGCDGCRGSRGGEAVGYDGQGKQGYVIFLGQTDGGRGGGKSGTKSALERCEGYAEVYGVVFDGGLDGVGFEDCVLTAPSQFGAVERMGCGAHYSKNPGSRSGHPSRQAG